VSALGAIPSGRRCAFTVWAPRSATVRVQLGTGRERDLLPTGKGYHQGAVEDCAPGTRYRYVLEDGRALPDPASRYQPNGVHGPSAVFDPREHRWSDSDFVAPPLWQYVIYELHIGTFTEAGTFDAAIEHLPELASLGVTAIEPMPVAQFPGRWNWGYDGVFPYAVQDTYGGPAALQRFADACHANGMALVLDVVYNHLGPEGNVLDAFGPYFTDRYRTPWGAAINYDGAGSDEVRRFFTENALTCLSEFHADALRLDAIHGIVDSTATPFLVELSRAVGELGQATGRQLHLIAESADNDPRVVAPPVAGGLGIDGQWNDDYHHALHSMLTGERAGYYADFGDLEQLAKAIATGFVYQGEHSAYRGRRHGAPSGAIEPERLVIFAQNHDHVGNRPAGERLASLVTAASARLAAAVLLLSPGIPLLFMGEEYGAVTPFPYFVDHGDDELRAAVRSGRAREMASLGLAGEEVDPTAASSHLAAVLDRTIRVDGMDRLYGELLRLRREHSSLARSRRGGASAQACGTLLTVLRASADEMAVCLFNFGGDPIVEVALPRGEGWTLLTSSADPAFGGEGPPEGHCLGAKGFQIYVKER